MIQLKGEFECKIDAKGRMRMPTVLLKQMGEEGPHSFVINRGVEKCLMLYPKEVWDVLSARVNKLNQYVKKNRDFVRYFYRGATDLSPDASDRVLLPKRLLEYAGIDKEIMLFAINDRIEVWEKGQYLRNLEEEPEDFSDLAEDVMGETGEAVQGLKPGE